MVFFSASYYGYQAFLNDRRGYTKLSPWRFSLSHVAANDWFLAPLAALNASLNPLSSILPLRISSLQQRLLKAQNAVAGGNNCSGGWPVAALDYMARFSQEQASYYYSVLCESILQRSAGCFLSLK